MTEETEIQNVIEVPSGGENAVVLPCEPRQFRDFISGLLGKPQTIARSIIGSFEIDKSDIENIYHLIDQRVTSQNDAVLVQFTARIIYDDNSSILLNTFEDFLSYKEVKPLISIGLHLSWTLLIQFTNREFPEKQVIDISFNTSKLDTGYSFSHDGFDSRGNLIYGYGGSIFFQINHTNRTWGTDIESLLNGQLQIYVKSESEAREFTYRHSGKIGWFSGISVFMSAIFAGILASNIFLDKYLSKAETLKGSDGNKVSQKINFLFDVVASGVWTRYSLYLSLYLLTVLFLSAMFGLLIESNASIKKQSFVLLTEGAYDNQTLKNKLRERKWWKFIASIIFAILIGVLGNYIFYYFMKNFIN